MFVIFDWVPGYRLGSYGLKTSRIYLKNALGEIIDPIDPTGESFGWTDIADLNYDNFSMRKAMKELCYTGLKRLI